MRVVKARMVITSALFYFIFIFYVLIFGFFTGGDGGEVGGYDHEEETGESAGGEKQVILSEDTF